jgi:hypothetical protein
VQCQQRGGDRWIHAVAAVARKRKSKARGHECPALGGHGVSRTGFALEPPERGQKLQTPIRWGQQNNTISLTDPFKAVATPRSLACKALILRGFSACRCPHARSILAKLRPRVVGSSQSGCDAAGRQRNLGSL